MHLLNRKERWDTMKKLIKLNYHSVFKYENDKESFKYNGAAFLEELDDKTIISYEDKTKIKFILKKEEVFLHNDASVLHLHKNRVILNHYQTEYGILKLQTRLINYEYDNTIKIKYALYDGMNLISEVYIVLNYQILEN